MSLVSDVFIFSSPPSSPFALPRFRLLSLLRNRHLESPVVIKPSASTSFVTRCICSPSPRRSRLGECESSIGRRARQILRFADGAR